MDEKHGSKKDRKNEMDTEEERRGGDGCWGPIFEVFDRSSQDSTADSVLELVGINGSIRGRKF